MRKKLKQNIMSKAFAKRSINKYSPHQGKKEKARRRKQIDKGILKCR